MKNSVRATSSATSPQQADRTDPDVLLLRIDGRRPISAESVSAVNGVCDAAEDDTARTRVVVVEVSGSPEGQRPEGLTVAMVSKWERALRRLERLPAPTVAVVDGDCGGTALDALLATDYRIAAGAVRLVVPVDGGATWPGMALYRLAQRGAGASAIRRAVLFGTPVELAEALELQLLDEVAADRAGAHTLAATRAGAVSGSELAIRRQLLDDAVTTGFDEALGVHLAACDRALRRAAVGVAS
ncbi:enoyl-CoA-hydratase DpgB [Kitasatospora sp. NPDC096128]|uniref:enoyl-CoA-hydratase DpgB n=1 Tax=Kitasatospora sp. NPDC096128 TaxID=3155547 RepID=UPI00332C17A2